MKNWILYLFCFLPFVLTAQESAFLGVHSNDVSNKKARILGFENSEGAYLTRIVPGTAAEEAGLQPFDYLVAFDDRDFSEDWNFHDAISEKNAGETVKISYIRDGKLKSRKVVLGKRTDASDDNRSDEEDPFLGIHQVHEKTPGVRYGVTVGISDCSTAEAMGLQDGDVITAIDGIPMVDWHDLAASINNREVGDPIRVTFTRDGREETREQPIRSLAATHRCDEAPAMTEEPALAAEEPGVVAEPSTEASMVSMANVTEEEAKAMEEEKGIDMPIVNNLSIEQLNLFPNPTTGAFELRFELPEEGPTVIRLYNSAGAVVYRVELGNFSGFFSDRIDISNQAKGFYFLEIRQGGLSLSKKLILQ